MRHSAAIVIAVVGLSSGCKSTGEQAAPPAPGAVSATTQQDPARAVQPANREVLEILVTLRRVHFAFDSQALTGAARAALDQAAEQLARFPDVALEVAGHADDRGTSEYNLGLGDRRARTVTDYLVHLGIARDRLRPISYGEEQPLVRGASQTSWAKNRRVDFSLLYGNVTFAVEDGALVDDAGDPLADETAA